MAGELEKALSKKIGSSNKNSDALIKAMSALLVLLLNSDVRIEEEPELLKDEDDILMEGMRDRITGRRKFSSLANALIAKPM